MGFFGFFRSALKQFGNFQYDFDDAQTHRIAVKLVAQGVALTKKAFLRRRNMRFEPENVKKWVFGVFRYALKRFGN